jgi:hypothetical protein
VDGQDLANLLTLCLGGATVWLGWETRRMAIATRQSVELQSIPYLAFAGLEYANAKAQRLVTATEHPAVRIGVQLLNPGQVLIQYEVESFTVTFESESVKDPKFDNRGGYIHPKAETIFRYPWIFVPAAPKAGQGGEVEFKINFWSSTFRISHVTARMRYTLQGDNLSRIEWQFLDGPTYA